MTQDSADCRDSTQALRVALLRGASCFDYQLPAQTPEPGCRVVVPVRKQEQVGIVLGVYPSQVAADKLRPIVEVLDERALIPHTLLKLIEWVADYYQSSITAVARAALPVAICSGKPPEPIQPKVWEHCEPSPDSETVDSLLKRADKQKLVYQTLQRIGAMDETALKSCFTQWRPSMHALEKKGLVRSHPWIANTSSERQEAEHALTKEQETALAKVRNSKGFACHLLQGITGSGKTEVYLRLADEVVSKGCQVLVLVPEINLIMQTAGHFSRRLGQKVACFHSGLSTTERLHCWSRVANGDIDVVVGTRSAVFLPFHKLSLIIVDEEHDLSYKETRRSRYHARDVAIKRAQINAIPIVLGSATPSLESLHNATQENKYQLTRLTQRFGKHAHLTQHMIDMRTQTSTHGLSKDLLAAMSRCLAREEQVLLFINRRGYAPVILCEECGAPCDCPQCDAHMVYHSKKKRMQCHHCATTTPLPKTCAACGSTQLKAVGIGIEQVERALRKIYPEACIVRFDRDAITRHSDLEEALKRAASGEAHILLGTQMLIKGHHFTGVSMVGVINTDNALFSADFRSQERLAQTLVQVSGRAGRGHVAGEVWIQTYHPQHPYLHLLASQDYAAVAQSLLTERKEDFLPPYCRLALLRAESKKQGLAQSFLQQFFDAVARRQGHQVSGITVYPPMPALMEKRRAYYRSRLLIKADSGHSLRAFLQRVMHFSQNNPLGTRVHWHIDIDPIYID